MLNPDTLLVDIGGTNIRYAFTRIGKNEFFGAQKSKLESLKSFDTFIKNLIESKNIKNIIFSVAGPKVNDSISMTNRNFRICSKTIKKKLHLENCFLLNDWEAIAYCIPSLKKGNFTNVKKGKKFNETSLILGPGTGLGMAVRAGDQNIISSEIGNTDIMLSGFLKHSRFEDHQFTKLEDLISGTGLSNLYEFQTGKRILAEQILDLYETGDSHASLVVNFFIEVFAKFLSQIGLMYLSGNGIKLAGSLVRSLKPLIDKSKFKRTFEEHTSKAYIEILEKISVDIIDQEFTCLYGLLVFANKNI